MATLFDPIRIGALDLPNRIIMAPLTRTRAVGGGRVPNELMRDYYVQRASAGLIITEATSVIPQGVGYPDTPGIWSQEQIDGWKMIVDAVHAAGGRIALQLWHVGRLSDSVYHDGKPAVAPSAIAADGHVSLIRPQKPYEVPRALETDEIPGIVEAYRQGAANAKAAGFDAVEIHGANGYLLDQFLQDGSNKRTDAYGGPIENRARLMLEVTDAVISVWGADRVGMHLAPRGDGQSMGDSDLKATFTYVAKELGKRGIAFVMTREAQDGYRFAQDVRQAFGGTYIANQGLTFDSATELLAKGEADAAGFGVPYIANPDLVERFASGAPLNAPRPELFYGGSAEGYTDYPTLQSVAA